jgi:hypothetical protein
MMTPNRERAASNLPTFTTGHLQLRRLLRVGLKFSLPRKPRPFWAGNPHARTRKHSAFNACATVAL